MASGVICPACGREVRILRVAGMAWRMMPAHLSILTGERCWAVSRIFHLPSCRQWTPFRRRKAVKT